MIRRHELLLDSLPSLAFFFFCQSSPMEKYKREQGELISNVGSRILMASMRIPTQEREETGPACCCEADIQNTKAFRYQEEVDKVGRCPKVDILLIHVGEVSH